jgi:hypothetical protein
MKIMFPPAVLVNNQYAPFSKKESHKPGAVNDAIQIYGNCSNPSS